MISLSFTFSLSLSGSVYLFLSYLTFFTSDKSCEKLRHQPQKQLHQLKLFLIFLSLACFKTKSSFTHIARALILISNLTFSLTFNDVCGLELNFSSIIFRVYFKAVHSFDPFCGFCLWMFFIVSVCAGEGILCALCLTRFLTFIYVLTCNIDGSFSFHL